MVYALRGMYAFAIWDNLEKSQFLARDPFGIKPLYYSNDGRSFRFASQVKALLAGGRISRETDPAGAAGFLLTGSVPEPFTIYRAIKALGAGESIYVDEQGLSIKRFYSLATHLHEALANLEPPTDLQTRVREALRDSIQAHRVSDVPIGVFLSAGIDSAAIVGLMRDGGHGVIDAVTARFPEFEATRDDEALLASTTAREYEVNHHIDTVGYDQFKNELPSFLSAMDQPTIDGVNVWFVSGAARRSKLKVCMSGLGADEMFGGYPAFADVPKWVQRLSWLPVRSLAARLYRVSERLHLPLHPKVIALVALGGTYPGAWLVSASRGLEQLDILRRIGEVTEPDPGTPFGRVMLMESALYMRNQLLRDSDWAGMAHSIEIRVPFADRILFERLGAPLAATQASKKYLIAGSLNKPLSRAVASRKKTGFNVPMAAWLERNPLADCRRWPRKYSSGHWSRRWALAVFSHLVQ
jgi:asparagine synthase (glutamine-hydrolysing)